MLSILHGGGIGILPMRAEEARATLSARSR